MTGVMTITPKEQESYSSPAMQARQRRILEETRALIAEQGIDGFSLLELCRRADVAKQTIYYNFGSKSRLVAAAIGDFFEESEASIPYHSPTGSLDRLIERTVAIGLRNVRMPHYVAAIIAFYFASAKEADLWEALHDIMVLPHRPYADGLAARGQLQPWIDAGQLVDALDGLRLSVANDWMHGRVDESSMIDRMVLNQLSYLVGVTKGAARREAEAALRSVTAMGALAYVHALPAGTHAKEAMIDG
jgi:AcrR family transcriptional regulator